MTRCDLGGPASRFDLGFMPKVDFTRPVGLHIQIAASKGCWFELAHLSGQGNRRSRGWEFSTRSLCPVPTRLSNAFLGLPSIALFSTRKTLPEGPPSSNLEERETTLFLSTPPQHGASHPLLSSPLLPSQPAFRRNIHAAAAAAAEYIKSGKSSLRRSPSGHEGDSFPLITPVELRLRISNTPE